MNWTQSCQVTNSAKYLWLASFPKSGNTWFRSFLSALQLGKVEINSLASHGILSGRGIFDTTHEINSGYLFDNEAKNKLAKVYEYNIQQYKTLQIIKAHDAYHLNDFGNPIVDVINTHKAVYLVRNPLDVVASYANHSNISIKQSIKALCDKKGVLGTKVRGFSARSQFPQLMYDWSGHVKSWLDQTDVPVVLVRYEDMKKDSVGTFNRVVQEIGFACTEEDVLNAIELTKFEKLKKQEEEKGFKEKMAHGNSFFRKGKVGGWREELTKEQAIYMVKSHQEVMERLGYLEEAVAYLSI